MVCVPLPIHLPRAAERLEYVRGQTRPLKHTERPAGTQALYEAAGLLPGPLRSPVTRAMAAPRQPAHAAGANSEASAPALA